VGRAFDADLTPREPGFLVQPSAFYPQFAYGFDWAAGPDGTFVVVGSQCTYDGEDDCYGDQVMGRRLNRTGKDLRGPFTVSVEDGPLYLSPQRGWRSPGRP
jgi:hypothetical protein